jgi:replication factor C small subunit
VHRETFNLEIPPRLKVELVDTIGEYDFRIKEGASELIQLEALLAQFVAITSDALKTTAKEGGGNRV